MSNARRFRVGSWVSLLASGLLSGVVVEDAGSGMVVVQVVVGEWMLDGAEPAVIDGESAKPGVHE